MIDLRPIAAVLGVLLAILGTTMMIPALVDLVAGQPDFIVYVGSAAVTVFVGLSLWLSGRSGAVEKLDLRQAFLLTTLSWVVLSGFAAIPFMWAQTHLSFTDAYFEAMSGLTTTGATVVSNLDTRPPGVLIWRAFLHWYGGIGIIVLAIAFLPMLQVGGMQLFRSESSEKSEKLLPRAAQMAKSILGTYLLLSFLCAVTYMFCGMSAFDAVAHAMSTISTGGFSTHDASLGYFKSAAVDYAAIVFMLAGSLPFVLYVRVLAGDFSRLVANTEVRLFFCLVAGFTFIGFVEEVRGGIAHGETALRWALFNVVSIMSTTGFVTVDYTNWGPPTDALYFILLFLGACTGSTAGGLKTFRLAIVGSALVQHLEAHRLSERRVPGALWRRADLRRGGDVGAVLRLPLSHLLHGDRHRGERARLRPRHLVLGGGHRGRQCRAGDRPGDRAGDELLGAAGPCDLAAVLRHAARAPRTVHRAGAVPAAFWVALKVR